ncbi:C40 family peptidase [Jeongeupia sp. USM3]|uniref:C40 family peptidase n=1 Tax=Jeongeupia sp. USM3 TaxID=1906741 RepID=UPI00089DD6DC|nr:C40 family peptidase [Jeongeupia sp. USM3]AOX99238.1 hypothetical protein BJP62_01475 [Jeongeupia sp. USM3]
MKWYRIPAALLAGACLALMQPLAHAEEPPADTGNWSRSSKEGGDNQAAAQELLLQAMSLIGVRYSWGGNTPEEGLDCSGFIRYVFQNSLNITLPRTALSMSQTGQTVNKDELKPGDLVFFNTLGRAFSHVGIYLGDNRFIHSPRAGKSVEVSNIQQSYWQQRWNGARRIAGASGSGINMTTLLASAGNSKARAVPRPAAVATAERQCRKVTTGKGSKRKTTTVCERSAAKPASAQSSTKPSSRKASAKPASGKSAKPAAKAAKKPAAKPSAKSSTKPAGKKPATATNKPAQKKT